jgi:Bax protein
MNWRELIILPVAVLLVVGFIVLERTSSTVPPSATIEQDIPDFASFKDVKEKKRTFFDFMLPMIRNANARTRTQRAMLEKLDKKLKTGQSLTSDEIGKLDGLVERYRVSPDTHSSTASQLLQRVDVVPASLILAQSANESAWGSSRFARDGNNFFGIWCFSKGCGLTPGRRDEGKTHEVARFDSIQQGVDHYLLTINTNDAYQELRQLRASSRARNREPTGAELAEGLTRYSERGIEYVREIQAMIRINNLQQFNLPSRG